MAASQAKRIALTIAGSDPGGGAGIQADLKTFAALGIYGYSAITMVIAQNSSTVRDTAPVAPAMIARQIEVVAAERVPDAIKIGALGTDAVVAAVARSIRDLRLPAPVLDPVIVSTAGRRLLNRAGERALVRQLLPLARVITPNIPEAEALTGIRITSDAAMRAAAQLLIAKGARAVVIKGGHQSGKAAVDLFHDGRRFIELRSRRVPGEGAHGTGCAFSAAIAAHLARGADLEAAVRAAKRYITAALKRSFRLGAGRPLLDHFV
jgi:hydroxymethylpyrimidine/phosphomethylpyrimidine kinase